MRNKYLLLIFSLLITVFSNAQDFSNKGKDFWVGYGYHIRMGQPSQQAEKMQLYITSDVSTTGQVTIPGIGFSQNFSITANAITTIDIPRSAALLDQNTYNLGIHITAEKPVVVYSFIYVNAVSGATVCLPTNTLGKEYYSVNFKQLSNEPSYSYFFVIATDTGTTSVEITPSAVTKGGQPANVTFPVTLTQGQVYQVLSSTDLTGSKIKSVSTGAAGCKRIGVYCGSGKISIGCNDPVTGSSDNLYQQMYPTAAWGKEYITMPSTNNGLNFQTNFYRIIRPDPTATVTLNGSVIPSSSFVNNFYYQFSGNSTNFIQSDKPIMVAQYFTTFGGNAATNCGNTGFGDPEMIYLNPLEQTISNVTLNSMQPSSNTAITTHFINVVLKNSPEVINSFKIDGASYSSKFSPVAQNPAYAYARIGVGSLGHTVTCDSGFNAIAYGFGNAESYGYSAGTNLRDLYQFVSIENGKAIVDFPAACKASPFYFSMTFPYQPTQIQWQFSGLFPDVTITTPVPDATTVVNGKTLYRYKLPTTYTLDTLGTFPIKVLAQNPTADGCSGEQEINYDLQIFDRPSADFNFVTNGCVSDSVRFTDLTDASGRTISKWNWNFDDGNNATIKNPAHLFTASGTFNVKFSIITDIGCVSDTMTKAVNLSQSPIAKFGASGPFCINKTITFTDTSSTPSGTLVKWYWDFGDGSPAVPATSAAAQTHTYTSNGNFEVSLQVETASGCKSAVFKKTILINPRPVASFDFGSGCLPNAIIQFTNNSSISDGTQATFTHAWTFGDGGVASIPSPSHTFTAAGPFTATLTVTSAAGCVDDTVRTVNTINAQPQAMFETPAEVCLGSATTFADKSSVSGSTVSQWLWSFDDGTTSNQQNPTKTFTAAGIHSVTLKVTSANGCASEIYQGTAVVNNLPTAKFTISTPTCEHGDITFTDHSTANDGTITKWSWNPGEGAPIDNTTAAMVVHNYATAGNYPVKLDITTSKGCTSSFVDTARIHFLPLTGFKMPENCLTDPFSQFTDTSKIADGSQTQFTYQWSFGDPNATAANPNIATGTTPRHKYTVATTYDVKLTVTSGFGCIDSITQKFTVNGAVPQSSFSIVGASNCSGDSVKIINNSSVDFGGIVKLEIFWDANDATLKTTDDSPITGRQYAFKYPDLFTATSKTYTIKVRAYSGDNCLNETTKDVTVLAKPQIELGPIASICANAPSFQINSGVINNGSIVPGTFVYSGAGVSANGQFNPASAGPGAHVVTYTYTGANGCSDAKTQTVEVFEVPLVNAGPDLFVLEGGSDSLLATATGINLTYVWSPARWLNNATVLRPKISPTDDQQYILTATSSDGCVATDAVLVKVLKAPTIPNVFTPNGDGRNDKWEIQYLETYPGATVEVYNRYGQLVFRSVGYSTAWDGTFNGKDLPIGTYYYIINPKNGRKQIAGFVDLIR